MDKVWKIGSRWSEFGTWNSRIITVFRRSNVVFVGGDSAARFKSEVTSGDYFAIADGLTIVAVARAISEVYPLSELIANGTVKVRDDEPFDLSWNFDECYGVKVKIVDLPASEQLYYPKRGTFFSANMYWDEVKELFNTKVNKSFDIAAKTYRLGNKVNSIDTKGYEKFSIFDGRTKYIIPVYQREYSWGVEQISKFIKDIFRGFWGTEEEHSVLENHDPMFIGTMQLSFKKFISSNEFEQDIVDGQQRLSTFLCLFKFLKLQYPSNGQVQNLPTSGWLETRVNNGKEDELLNEMLHLKSFDDARDILSTHSNRYLENILLIKDEFGQCICDEKGSENPLFTDNLDSFVRYLLEDIYMVVVETVAGLSKTIQIFNTINTTGLDLNGDDLFKVRFYEYLQDYQNADESAFTEIGNKYKKIKDINDKWRKTHDYDVVTMHKVRSIYKDYLIARYNLPDSLYHMATDTFYDTLFDVLLNVQEHKELTNTKGLVMSLEDIDRIIDICYAWNSRELPSPEDLISKLIIDKSRYSRYRSFAYQVLLATDSIDIEEKFSRAYDCLKGLSKIFFCYSIIYEKRINDVFYSFMNASYNIVIQKGIDAVLEHINNKLSSINRGWVTKAIQQVIADNRVWKDLICCLSAYFDEKDKTPLEEMEEKLSGGYDIEHIHANADGDMDFDYSLQNSIGNLMLLEYDINRSIGCEVFHDKVNGIPGHMSYQDSKYVTVAKIAKMQKWDKLGAERRLSDETEKIMNFLFSGVQVKLAHNA